MDRFGVDVFLPFEDRVNTVAALARDGYTDRMVLGPRLLVLQRLLPGAAPIGAAPQLESRPHQRRRVPALRERGVTEDQITTMLVDNPRKIFERPVGAY